MNLIHAVCSKLDEYIHQTKPSHTIFIAFDGVAPVAKLEQQRNRRYKSTLEKQMMIALGFSETQKWSSTAITPGTHFMEKLGTYITDYYKKKEASYGVKKIIVSTSTHNLQEQLFNSDLPCLGKLLIFQFTLILSKV